MSTLKRWLKKKEVTVPRGLIPPIKVKEILKGLGYEEEPQKAGQVFRRRK
ncbi:MAG: hypothetical protein KIPDCIKN_02856 [Haliscomenobacter sp.]|jgi:hypothetical protein|nr:hypothetical protein [Haliscomenobacter sp.]